MTAVRVGGGSASRLAERHFTAQQAATSAAPEVAALHPLLRCLLFTDGTVTRALEAQTLQTVAVSVVEQVAVELPVHLALHLQAPAGCECVRRRVAMSIAGRPPAVWAESHILPARLPDGFLPSLDGAPQGIGGSLEEVKLESRRELLWFALDAAPVWADPSQRAPDALVRLYRIVSRERPALLISESFAIERDGELYRPLGHTPWRQGVTATPAMSGRAAHADNGSI